MPEDPSLRTRLRADESTLAFLNSVAGGLLLGATLIYVTWLFLPLAPPERLWTWVAAMGSVSAAMVLVPAAHHFRRPSQEETLKVWAPIGKVTAIAFVASVTASVWLLLPYASEPLRLLMIVFYAACVIGQVLVAAEALEMVALGVVCIYGSAALFSLLSGGAYSAPVAVFLVGLGALNLGVALALKIAIRQAFLARINAEEQSAARAQALVAVEAERDAKTRFLAAASHDIRQPLHAAALFFEQVVSERRGKDSDAVAGVRRAFAASDALLDQVLAHLRLDAGVVQARPAPTALAALIEEVAAEVRPLGEAAGLTVTVAGARNAFALADAELTARVLRNLAWNAVRHSRGRRMLIGVRRAAGQVRVVVADDGVGVPAGERELIFQEYRQGAEATRSPAGGLGLGLASARRLAALMDGALGLAHSRTGSRFELVLPRSGPPAPAAAPALDEPALRPLSVLVIDDDEDARAALSALLARWGWRVGAYGCGTSAAEAAAGLRPDLILSDWRLADLETGAQAVAAVRAALGDRSPAIILSGDGSAESHAAIAASGLPVLYKPVRPAKLRALARHLTGELHPSG